jgi:hypothetical protein
MLMYFQKEVRSQGSIEILLALMEQCGVEQAIACAPFPSQVEGTSLAEALRGREDLFG